MKTLATAAALAALLASPTFAQDGSTADQPAAQEEQAPGSAGAPTDPNAAAQQPGDSGATDDSAATGDSATDDSAVTEGDSATQDMAAQGQGERFLSQQDQNQMLGSEIIGATVYNSSDENLGSISDLLVDKESGEIVAAIVGVGGFLGIGAKNVAVSFDQIEQSTDENGDIRLMLNASKEDLDAAPEFVSLDDQKSDAAAGGEAAPGMTEQQPADPMAPAPADPADPAQPAPAQ